MDVSVRRSWWVMYLGRSRRPGGQALGFDGQILECNRRVQGDSHHTSLITGCGNSLVTSATKTCACTTDHQAANETLVFLFQTHSKRLHSRPGNDVADQVVVNIDQNTRISPLVESRRACTAGSLRSTTADHCANQSQQHSPKQSRLLIISNLLRLTHCG